jgi:hypothetical protein
VHRPLQRQRRARRRVGQRPAPRRRAAQVTEVDWTLPD